VQRSEPDPVAGPPDPAGPPELALALPPPPPDAQRPAFPWLASVAPVLGALVLWGVTGSPVALAFAALGPVVALASIVDGRRHAVRHRRRAMRARRAALDALRVEIRLRHDTERRRAWQRSPSARECAAGPAGTGWRHEEPGRVVLGRADGPSALRIAGSPTDEHDRELLRAAAHVDDVPVLADAVGGIGLVGPGSLARAAGRAALVQLAERALPGVVRVEAPATPAWAWCEALPHRLGDRRVVVSEHDGIGHEGAGVRPAGTARARDAGGAGAPGLLPSPVIRIAIATTTGDLPPGLRTVLRLEHPRRAVLERHEGMARTRELIPELLSTADAAGWAERARAAAARAGLAALAPIPRHADADDLPRPARRRTDRSSLAVTVGIGPDGPLELDLARDGPHALVAGTSGSGKSAFLLTWLAALAAVHPPELVAFLLVDFKGGAAFEPLRGLPHVAGIVTDLDEPEALRAVASLRAELRLREERLREAGARDLIELGLERVLPRLVIVVDEFQAMVERLPDLAPLIADIASRGRSLGVHLVLAAQRPNGVVRESVLANCGLRVSLRVLHRADSVAVLGVERAAALDPSCPGRAVIARDGVPVEFQTALTSGVSLAGLIEQADGPPARRPWLDPLPARIDPADPALSGDDASAGGLVFGLADEPERQRRSAATWRPVEDGSILVLGAPGSGRTTALGALARAFAAGYGDAAVAVIAGGASREWDLVHEALDRVRRGDRAPRLLVIDDLDRRFRTWPETHRFAMIEAIEALAGEGRAVGLAVAASAISARPLAAGLREELGSTLLLRHASRADLVAAGGAGEHWRADDPPGAGRWRGRRVQLVDAGPPPSPAPIAMPPLELSEAGFAAVVSRAPAVDADRLATTTALPVVVLRPGVPAATTPSAIAAGGPVQVFVGDAEAWAANWALLAAVRERGDLIVHAAAADYLSVVRDREPPPMLDPGAAQCWLLRAGTRPVRRAWPEGDGTTDSSPRGAIGR
jgi:S-DNA-T family DNA segregation ATPase FtsK/SpoIIIE